MEQLTGASKEKIGEYLSQIRDLNIVPPVLIQVMALPDDNELSFKELSRLVQTDQILVSRIIKIANSPFYNRGVEINSIQNAIARLGFRLIRSMIVVAMNDSIFAHGNYRKFREEVWQHSIATSIYGHKLAEEFLGKQEGDKGMIAGLLLDIGKVILNIIDRKKYVEVLREYIETRKDIRSLEIEKFQVDHVTIGYAAAKLWKLPEFITQTILDRHLPVEKKSLLGVILTATNALVRKAGFGVYAPHHEQELLECEAQLKTNLNALPVIEIQKYIKEHELYKTIYYV